MKQTKLNFKTSCHSQLIMPISQIFESSSELIGSFSSIIISKNSTPPALVSNPKTVEDGENIFEIESVAPVYSENSPNLSSKIGSEIEKMMPDKPKNFKPIKDKYNRYFKIKWYENFNWLEYNVIEDRAFCFICRMFNRNDTKSDSFVTTGFKTWKNADDRFGEHEKIDGTTDITHKEQISLCIRTVSKDLSIDEHFLEFYEARDTSGDTLFNLVKKAIGDLSLSLDDLTGQCYDGASNMAGVYQVFASRIKNEVPHALYVHCYAHRLNLALQDSFNEIQEIRYFLGQVNSIYVLIISGIIH
ncbi:unnamed protein product [Brachionus calyciflorus]|uniref:TTF-type domain-containing protein n=1 Tax=Brachionus calyciflorus TaxID=104777 RepID=A0A814D9V9_9BILA|nr:unnamed protein product [Brachionus calyciflorus]